MPISNIGIFSLKIFWNINCFSMYNRTDAGALCKFIFDVMALSKCEC